MAFEFQPMLVSFLSVLVSKSMSSVFSSIHECVWINQHDTDKSRLIESPVLSSDM